ncbi:unnamed protein product [Musa banksii]
MDMSWLMDTKTFLQAYPDIGLAFVCFAFFFFFCYCYYDRICRSRSRIPVNWPVVGMLPALLVNLHRLHDWGTDVLREAGCSFWFRGPWFLGMNHLLTCDPANVHHVFGANFSNYPKGEAFLEIFDILGDGIFNSDEQSWKEQRTKAHSIMSGRRFRTFVADSARSKVEKGLLPLIHHIAQRGVAVDLQDVFLRLTFDTTCNLVFGVDPRCLSVEFPTIPFARAMDDAMAALLTRQTVPPAWWKLMRWLRVGEEKKLAMAWKEVDHFIAEHIAEKKRSGEANDDMLSAYINDNDDDNDRAMDGKRSTEFDKFLRDTAVNFMLAGRDTTGAALTWFFWLLSQNPMLEAKILKELEEATSLRKERPSSDELIVFGTDELGKMVYLHAALCESLRFFPPVPFEHKSVLQSEVLPSGHRVGQGTKILVSAYAMGRMEGVWGGDWAEVRPERWISEKGRMRYEPSYKFLAFNSGPRACMGKDVAFAQMKTVVAAMVYNFHVEVLRGPVAAPKLSIILQMKNGLMARIERRRDRK